MKRVVRFVIGLLILCLALTACQPTPEEEIVTNKGDGVMEEKIFATAVPTAEVNAEEEVSPEPTAVPFEKVEHWTETFNVNDNFTVEIDCDVEWGEGYTYSVEKFLPGTFTGEQVIEIGNTFFGGVESIREQETSYDELLEKLKDLEQGSYEGKDADGNPIFEPYDRSYKKEQSNKLKAQLAETPTESTYIPFTIENLPIAEETRSGFTIKKADGTEGRIGVSLFEGKSKITFENYTKGGTTSAAAIQQEILLSGGEYYDTLPEPSITAEEAITMADAFLASVGLANTECSYSEKVRLGKFGEAYSEGWYLEYAPMLKGTRGINLYAYQKNYLINSELANSYSRPLEAEYINLYVTEEGVQSFGWVNPYELQEVINTNVETLSFEEIQESVRKYFTLAFSWVENPKSYDSSKLIVKRIVLTSYFTQVKDDPEGAYRVPVWAIFYITDGEEALSLENSVMLINALDGTMIYK